MNVVQLMSAGRRRAVGLDKFASLRTAAANYYSYNGLSVVRRASASDFINNPQNQQQQSFSTGSRSDSSSQPTPQMLLSTAAKEAQRLSDLAAERRPAFTKSNGDNNSFPSSHSIAPPPHASAYAVTSAPPLITNNNASVEIPQAQKQEQQRRVQNAMDAATALLIVTSRSTPLQDAVCSSTADATVRKQVACLHRAFLAVTNWCLDVLASAKATTSSTKENENSKEMLFKIIQLARRAHELQLAFTLPMYQQLMVAAVNHYHPDQQQWNPKEPPSKQQLRRRGKKGEAEPPSLSQLPSLYHQLIEISTWISCQLGTLKSFRVFGEPIMVLAEAKHWKEVAMLMDGLLDAHQHLVEVDVDTTIELLVALQDEFPTDQQDLRNLSPFLPPSKTKLPKWPLDDQLLHVREILVLLDDELVHTWLQAYDKNYFEGESDDGFWDDVAGCDDDDFSDDDDDFDDDDESGQQLYTEEELKGDGMWKDEVYSYREYISLRQGNDNGASSSESLLPPLPSAAYYAAKAAASRSTPDVCYKFDGVLPDVTAQFTDLFLMELPQSATSEILISAKSCAKSRNYNKPLEFKDYPSAAEAVQSANIAAKAKYGILPDVAAQFNYLNGGRGIDFFNEEFEREIVQLITSVKWKDEDGDNFSDSDAYEWDDDDDGDDDIDDGDDDDDEG